MIDDNSSEIFKNVETVLQKISFQVALVWNTVVLKKYVIKLVKFCFQDLEKFELKIEKNV